MPLITGKSPKAFVKNLKTEMSAGKPQKQALAIAYSKKREAERLKKMWQGGVAEEQEDVEPLTHVSSGEPHTDNLLTSEQPYADQPNETDSEQDAVSHMKYAHGGKVEKPMDEHTRMKRAMMALGGMVDHQNFPAEPKNKQEEPELHAGKHDPRVGEENVETEHDASLEAHLVSDSQEDEEDFGESNYAHGGHVMKKKYAHGGYAKGGMTPKHAFAMHLKKKMRGY